MATTVKVQANFAWLVHRRAPDRRWVAVCDALNLAMEAESLDELHSVIGEAIDLLMRDLLRDSELERYLQDRGWEAIGIPAPNTSDVHFQVPIELIVQSMHGIERRAH